MTGWRLGWLVAPQRYVREIEKLAQNLYIAPSTVAQHAALAAFRPETTAILEARREEFSRRRDFLLPGLRKLGFKIAAEPQGAFYIYADSSGTGRRQLRTRPAAAYQGGRGRNPGPRLRQERCRRATCALPTRLTRADRGRPCPHGQASGRRIAAEPLNTEHRPVRIEKRKRVPNCRHALAIHLAPRSAPQD
jgi:histidinol-phosphate/aromatic aminotransferase/cobyric acid decarboxylase-like protein